MHTRFSSENLKRERPFGRLKCGSEGNTVECGKLWTGCMSLRIGARDGTL
jgi:hypothetical protein